MAIITEAQVKLFGGVGASPNATLLALVVAAAQDAAEKYCGFEFDSAETTEYKDAVDDSKTLYLKKKGIDTEETIAVYYDATGDFAASTAVDATTYHVLADAGQIILDTPYDGGTYRWKIAYTGGWDEDTAPASLRFAIVGLAAFLYKKAKAGNWGLENDSPGTAQTLKFQTMIPPDVAVLLNLHRRYVVE